MYRIVIAIVLGKNKNEKTVVDASDPGVAAQRRPGADECDQVSFDVMRPTANWSTLRLLLILKKPK